MSEKKAAASRENGTQSVGPKTPEGQERSSKNALKLGIFSERKFLDEENPAEFQQLLAALELDLAPVGVLEAHYVNQIATAIWRKRRVERAELGAIRRGRTEFMYGLLEKQWSELAPTFVHQVSRYSEESVKRLEALRDDIAMQVRSVAPDDEKFSRVETSLDRALERAVKGLREAQRARRESIEAVILTPERPSRSREASATSLSEVTEAELAEVEAG